MNKKDTAYAKRMKEREFLIQHYELLALDVFEWKNLPEGLESRFFEKALFNYGKAFFFYDEKLGYTILPYITATKDGKPVFNIYGEENAVQVLSYNGTPYINILSIDEGVRILNNDLGIGSRFKILKKIDELVYVKGILNQNLEGQRFPIIINTNGDTQQRMKQLKRSITDEEETFIYGNKDTIQKDDIEAIKTDIPYIVDKLRNEYEAREAELLSMLGLNNVKEKEGGMSEVEVNSNNDTIDRNVELLFKTRKAAEKIINEKFNLNIEVIKKNDVYESLLKSKNELIKAEEGDDDEY